MTPTIIAILHLPTSLDFHDIQLDVSTLHTHYQRKWAGHLNSKASEIKQINKVICKVTRLGGGKNGQFRHNRASNV
jgi:hypothetical protein